jgi:hypothetical protein
MRQRALLFGSLIVAAIALGLSFVITRESPEKRAPVVASSEPAVATTNAAPSVTTVTMATATSSATAAPSVAPTASASSDPFAEREAIVAAVERKDVSMLPTLAKTDLAKNGYVAAAAIDAVGKLAAIAPEPARHDAVETLKRWLKDETARGKTANDAIGNTSLIVDALKTSGSPEAAAPLIAALDAGDQPLHIETRIVQTLDAMDAKSAAPVVEKFATRVKSLTPHEELERELQKEALEAADAALAKWR